MIPSFSNFVYVTISSVDSILTSSVVVVLISGLPKKYVWGPFHLHNCYYNNL